MRGAKFFRALLAGMLAAGLSACVATVGPGYAAYRSYPYYYRVYPSVTLEGSLFYAGPYRYRPYYKPYYPYYKPYYRPYYRPYFYRPHGYWRAPGFSGRPWVGPGWGPRGPRAGWGWHR